MPLPGAANDHQTANAAAYAARTGAAVVPESQWDTARIAAQIEAIVGNPQELRSRREDAASWSNADAALKVVRACERLLQAHQPAKALAESTALIDPRP